MKYINMVSNENVDIDTLLQKVSTDPQLQAINKQAVICYITTYVASSEYWQEHYTDWAEILDITLTRTRFNWKMLQLPMPYMAIKDYYSLALT